MRTVTRRPVSVVVRSTVFSAVSADTAPATLYLAEEAMFNGVPRGGIRRIMRDAQKHSQPLGQGEQILLKSQRSSGITAAAIAEHEQFGGRAVAVAKQYGACYVCCG